MIPNNREADDFTYLPSHNTGRIVPHSATDGISAFRPLHHSHPQMIPYQINHTAMLATMPFTHGFQSMNIVSKPFPTIAPAKLTAKNNTNSTSRLHASQALRDGNDVANNINQLQITIAVGHQ